MTENRKAAAPNAAAALPAQQSAEDKWRALLAKLASAKQQGAALALSGGVDSGLLAFACREAGLQPCRCYTFASELIPAQELAAAAALAAWLQLEWQQLELSVLQLPAVAQNRHDRCYHCKLAMYARLRQAAESRGLMLLADGVNADDLQTYRPGNRAAAECGVRHPLAEAGLRKAEIRLLARRFGLPNHDRPASPCLASRFPYDTPLCLPALQAVQAGEDFLHSLGFPALRLRAHGALARIEAPPAELARLLAWREPVCGRLRELGFSYITLDLEGLIYGRFDREQPLQTAGQQTPAGADRGGAAAACQAQASAKQEEEREQ